MRILIRCPNAEYEISSTLSRAVPSVVEMVERKLKTPVGENMTLWDAKPTSWFYTDGTTEPLARAVVARRLLMQLWSEAGAHVPILVCILGGPRSHFTVHVTAQEEEARNPEQLLIDLEYNLGKRGIVWLGDVGAPVSSNEE